MIINCWFSSILISAASFAVGYSLRPGTTSKSDERASEATTPRTGTPNRRLAGSPSHMIEKLDPGFARVAQANLEETFLEEMFSHLANRSPEAKGRFGELLGTRCDC